MQDIDIHQSIYDPHGNPLNYPGGSIEMPVLVMDGKYEPLTASYDFKTFQTLNGLPIETALKENGVAVPRQRVAQIAFGANRNLANIAWKFHHYKMLDNTISQDFIALPGFLKNADVVACNIGYWGYIYAGLLADSQKSGLRPYLQGARCPVTLLLLDEAQMKAVHHSEGVVLPGQDPPGVCCNVSEMEVWLSKSTACMAQIYSLQVPFLSFDGKHPLALNSVKTIGRGNYPALSQEELFIRINGFLGAETVLPGRIPIAETLRQETLLHLKKGVAETRKMTNHHLYTSVRSALFENYALKDRDGAVRRGMEDILPLRSEEDCWKPTPVFQPYSYMKELP